MDNAIEVINLTKKFKDLIAVNNITFNVKKGEIFAFLGPNGAGKTTTIKMLTTLLKPTSGKILVNNADPLTNPDEVRRSFGIVFQDPSLDEELTAFENMELHAVLYSVPKKLMKKKINDSLKFVDLFERKDDAVEKFSGGMRRRLEVARSLLHKPEILFLDELTLGLDVQTRNRIWSYLKKLNKEEKTTIFFTTHYMEEAEKVADRIAIIDRGRIVALGTLSELKIKTKTNSLEEAFLKLTGGKIREEGAFDMLKFMMMKKGKN